MYDADLDIQWETDEDLNPPPGKIIPAADLELLVLAARALGAQFQEVDGEGYGNLRFPDGSVVPCWNSLHFSGDTFDLAADLELDVMHRVVGGRRVEVLAAGGPLIQEFYESDRNAAIRLAVTRAAAEIGAKISQCEHAAAPARPARGK